MSKKCITNCYKFMDNNQRYLHPFLGIGIVENNTFDNICIKNTFKDSTNYLTACDSNVEYENNILNVIKNIIDPTEYLLLYYKLKNIDDIIEYFKKNKQISIYTKIRILDLTYIKYAEDIENDILKWIDLLKLLLDEKINDKLITNILKNLKNDPELNIKNYPLNLLLKIKKYLNNNI
jgi:hypothetical protein